MANANGEVMDVTMEADEMLEQLVASAATFDESQVPLEHRIASVNAQLAEWREIAYRGMIALQTNVEAGVPLAELGQLTAQFKRGYQAVKSLEARLAVLRREQSSEASLAAKE